MKKIVMQLWREYESGWGSRPDGCSLHVTMDNRTAFVDKKLSTRSNDVPDIYDDPHGNGLYVYVDKEIYDEVSVNQDLWVSESRLNKLLNEEKIKLAPND